MSIRTATLRAVAAGGLATRGAVTARTVSQTERRHVGGTSTPPHSSNSPDLKWIIGGVVVLVPTAYYFMGRSAMKDGEDIANKAKEVPRTEKYGTSQSQSGLGGSGSGASQPANLRDSGDPIGALDGKELSETMGRAIKADAPKSAYKDEEQKSKSAK